MGIFKLTEGERSVWRKIKPGETVKFWVKSDPHEAYVSRIIYVDDERLGISTPLVHNMFLELPENSLVMVEIFTPDFGKIIFKTRVLSQEWLKHHTMELGCPRRITKVQLRRYYRLETFIDAEYLVVSGLKSMFTHGQLKFSASPAITKNVSETGMMLIGSRRLSAGSLLDLTLKLPGRHAVRLQAKVVRVKHLEKTGKYGLGVEILKISPADKDLLRRFIFSKGRELYSREK
jgi:c-di-GMP-binding flagellar brake protein YcgR